MPLSAEQLFKIAQAMHFEIEGGIDVELDAKAATIRITGADEVARRSVIVALAESLMRSA